MAGAGVIIEAVTAVATVLGGYLLGVVFIIAVAVSLAGCSEARLSPSLLLGNSAGTPIGSATGSASASSFSGLPGAAPEALVGIQLRD